jgi:hypothetical protein
MSSAETSVEDGCKRRRWWRTDTWAWRLQSMEMVAESSVSAEVLPARAVRPFPVEACRGIGIGSGGDGDDCDDDDDEYTGRGNAGSDGGNHVAGVDDGKGSGEGMGAA